tara:strand:- start:24234 stop:26270 length:2037 start_codon:yes stop_codon:yes gene_type:complete
MDGAISIYIDRKRNNSNPINIPARKPSVWVPNKKVNTCFECGAEFGYLIRKHHCRSCGRIFCYDCSKWYCKKNEYITQPTPPEKSYLDFTQYMEDKNMLRVCKSCNDSVNVTHEYEKEIHIFLNLPIKISNLVYLRTVSKKWCKIINYIISVYRNIQYKISCQKISKIEKTLLWNHRYEFKEHYTLIVKCITSNNDKSKEEIDKLIKYYKDPTKKKYTCRQLLCKSACKNHCTSENVLELGFNTDLIKHVCVEKYLVEKLTSKLQDNLLMPWLVELSKKNYHFGMDLAYKCTMDLNMFYSFYFETKYYLNSFDSNENLKLMMEKILTLVPNDWIADIRKTDEFIKFIELLVTKNSSERCGLVHNWFTQNGSVRMPWNPERLCCDIELIGIKKLNSTSKPWIIPLITETYKYHGKTKRYILVKREDLRKDKLTMYVSKWLKRICGDELIVNTYNVLPYRYNYGWIEILDNTITLYDLIEVRQTTLLNYIMDLNPNETIQKMRETFIKSCVSSCVLCYILGVGDRHTENILINKWGDLIHIDFSYLLGEDPKHVDVEMKITNDMVEALGGKQSANFMRFKVICGKIYKKIRKRSGLWYILLSYLSFIEPSIYPYYNNNQLIKDYVIEKLIPGEFDEECSLQISNIVENSSNPSYMETISDLSHKVSNRVKQFYNTMFTME